MTNHEIEQAQKQDGLPGQEKTPIKPLIFIILAIVAYFAGDIWLKHCIRTDSLHQPLYAAIYVLGLFLCDAVVIILTLVTKNDNTDQDDAEFFIPATELLEDASPFCRWFAKNEFQIFVAFVLEFFYLTNWNWFGGFDQRYSFHIAVGIWLLVSTTVAVCGFIAMRNVRKAERDMQAERPPKQEKKAEDDDVLTYCRYKFAWWWLCLARYAVAIVCVIMWL